MHLNSLEFQAHATQRGSSAQCSEQEEEPSHISISLITKVLGAVLESEQSQLAGTGVDEVIIEAVVIAEAAVVVFVVVVGIVLVVAVPPPRYHVDLSYMN